MTNGLTTAKRIVIKVGSALLVDEATGSVSHAWLSAFAADVARLRARSQQVLVVSSGAVALGRGRLGLGKGKLDLPQKQAAAAAGQSLLMHAWEQAFDPHKLTCAQVLLTRDDTETRERWLNGRATIETLLTCGLIPVVNENDTVATDEIRYGDNDRLAARVAQMIGADLLVLLSDVDGLYTADPRSNPDAQHIPLVEDLTPEIEAMAGGANAATGVGTGGMETKLAAAARATLFAAKDTPAAAYKQWLAGSLAPRGYLTVDDGAAKALESGKSLLPAGVRDVKGSFAKGDAVVIIDLTGAEIGRGLVRYEAGEAKQIKGLKSADIEAVLGYSAGAVLIHADDLALARR